MMVQLIHKELYKSYTYALKFFYRKSTKSQNQIKVMGKNSHKQSNVNYYV